MRERKGWYGRGRSKKPGKLVTLLSAGFLSARLNFCCSVYTLRPEWLGAFSPRRRRPHLGRHDGQTDPPASPLLPLNHRLPGEGWPATFQRGFIAVHHEFWGKFLRDSKQGRRVEWARDAFREMNGSAMNFSKRHLTRGAGGVTNDFPMYRCTPFPFFFVNFSSKRFFFAS